MKYKSILVTQNGGLEAIRIMENELRQPVEGEGYENDYTHV
jgi:hypothetical protein